MIDILAPTVSATIEAVGVAVSVEEASKKDSSPMTCPLSMDLRDYYLADSKNTPIGWFLLRSSW